MVLHTVIIKASIVHVLPVNQFNNENFASLIIQVVLATVNDDVKLMNHVEIPRKNANR